MKREGVYDEVEWKRERGGGEGELMLEVFSFADVVILARGGERGFGR